jgi:hypothetical protein
MATRRPALDCVPINIRTERFRVPVSEGSWCGPHRLLDRHRVLSSSPGLHGCRRGLQAGTARRYAS